MTSELDNSNGRKYGLGSSGAVTVATVKALNLYYQMEMDRLTQFKIAALAHLAVQGNGSCGDIAALAMAAGSLFQPSITTGS